MSDGQGESSVADVRVVVFTPGPKTWVVNSPDDTNDGLCDENHCTLREAIFNANYLDGSDNIYFDIPGTGPHTIRLTSPLPEITDPVVIDGYTQLDASLATTATNAILMIELDGTGAGTTSEASGLTISSGSTTVRGLAINRFYEFGIYIISNDNNLIEGNFIGTDATGSQQLGNNQSGIWVTTDNNVIGGINPEARNIISNNGYHGIMMSGRNNVVQGNLIGTDITGTQKMGNSGSGIFLRTGANVNYIGGPEAGAGNVISGNVSGIFINKVPNNSSPSSNIIQGNFIGTDITGIAPLGNDGSGITIQAGYDHLIGGPGTAEGNVIAFNGNSGVWIYYGTGNAILSNAIFSNGKIGIDLADLPNYVTPNDPGDPDTGPNDYQNFPILNSVTGNATSTTLEGTLNSTPNTSFTINFFSNTAGDPSGFGEGETYIGETTVTTDAGGNANFNVTLLTAVPQGSFITSTATSSDNSTSEFSEAILSSDIEPPVLSGVPPDVTVECNAVPIPATVTAMDNVDGSVPVSFSEVRTNGSCENSYILTRTWTATDEAGNPATDNQTITVVDAEPPVINSPADLTIECDESSDPSNTGIASAADNCDGNPLVTYTDLQLPGSCANEFNINRTWTATDACGNKATETQIISVIDVTKPVVIGIPTELIMQGNDLGACGATITYHMAIVATDNCSGNVDLSVLPGSGSFFPVGVTTVNVSATDACGNTVNASFDVMVTNAKPLIESITAPVDPVQMGTAIYAIATHADNNLDEASWDWGDGITSPGIISGQTITGNHQYEIPGVYTLTLTITDLCGETDKEVYQYIVIYDPDGGFVTGGGWIYSPPGAYVNDPLLEGKANFGFVSKYKKGSTVPTGNTEFQFKAGNLNFNSNSYDWLVIAGSKAKFKGVGTINGLGTYGFMISAIDGDLHGDGADRLRIKIWDKEKNDVIVYDNEFEGAEYADPATIIGAGSIVIHTSGSNKGVQDMDESKINKVNIYPNPFYNSIHIDLIWDQTSKVIIDLVDINGKVNKIVYSGTIEAGVYYQLEFETGNKLSSGLYILRIRSTAGEYYVREVLIKK